MMLHAGLPTPEMQRQRDLTNLLEISNAQSNQGLRAAHEGLYRLQSQMADRQMPDGRWIQVPIAHVGAFDAAMAKIQAAPDKTVNPQQATFDYLTPPVAQGGKGLAPDAAYQLIQKPPADISPDRETFNYYTRSKEQGGLGLSPAQAYDKMHPRQNLMMGSTDVKDIADAIESGDQPRPLPGSTETLPRYERSWHGAECPLPAWRLTGKPRNATWRHSTDRSRCGCARR